MTEIEFAELWFMAIESGYNTHMMLITSIFAYIVAGHFVGKTVTKGIAVGLTVVFSIFSLNTLLNVFGNVMHLKLISAHYYESFPHGYAVPPVNMSLGLIITVTAAPTIIIWVGAIYYLHFHVRKSVSDLQATAADN